jgi:UDP-glucose 4-epimerase
LVDELINEGHEVTVVDNLSSGNKKHIISYLIDRLIFTSPSLILLKYPSHLPDIR